MMTSRYSDLIETTWTLHCCVLLISLSSFAFTFAARLGNYTAMFIWCMCQLLLFRFCFSACWIYFDMDKIIENLLKGYLVFAAVMLPLSVLFLFVFDEGTFSYASVAALTLLMENNVLAAEVRCKKNAQRTEENKMKQVEFYLFQRRPARAPYFARARLAQRAFELFTPFL